MTEANEGKRSVVKKKYAFLARKYIDLRKGTVPTGETIELVQNPDGTFNVTGSNPDGTVAWKSLLRMSLDEEDIGTAVYKYPLRANYGTQRVMYFPLLDRLLVVGTNQSTTLHTEFVHEGPVIHQGKILS
jgi:hypothetical protein